MNYMYCYTIISIEWLLKILTGNNDTVIIQNVARNSSSFPVLPQKAWVVTAQAIITMKTDNNLMIPTMSESRLMIPIGNTRSLKFTRRISLLIIGCYYPED